jgi:uncharacterized protein (DUF885 family)
MHIMKEMGSKTEPISLGGLLFQELLQGRRFLVDKGVREDSL